MPFMKVKFRILFTNIILHLKSKRIWKTISIENVINRVKSKGTQETGKGKEKEKGERKERKAV